MKLTMESTEVITEIDGVPVRVWNGRTEGGVECVAFVHRLAVREDHDASQFEAELLATAQPRTVVAPLAVALDLLHIIR